MEEKKYLNENQALRSKRQQKYAGKMIKRVPFSLHIINDSDIIDKLESVDNVQGYIKNLIRMDMRN
jgi:hypothetical protein